MGTRRQRSETFEVRDGHLIREVVPRTGEPYEHRCPIDAFNSIAQAIDEIGKEGFTLETLFYRENVPWTQVAVAIAFLKERGIIETRYRRNHAVTTTGVHLDAMTEYHALADGA
jgi:predicted transcriptional regulator